LYFRYLIVKDPKNQKAPRSFRRRGFRGFEIKHKITLGPPPARTDIRTTNS
jgi:hypothetical protein